MNLRSKPRLAKENSAKTGANAKTKLGQLNATQKMTVEHMRADLAKEKIGTDSYNKKMKAISDYGTKYQISSELFGVPSYIGGQDDATPAGKSHDELKADIYGSN